MTQVTRVQKGVVQSLGLYSLIGIGFMGMVAWDIVKAVREKNSNKDEKETEPCEQ